MKVISWNLAGRRRCIPQQVERLASRIPDVVALQEVRRPRLPLLRTLLAKGGLIHQADSFELAPCPTILQKTADTTGGRYFPATDAARLQTIFEEILEQVADVFLDLRIPAASVSAVAGRSVPVSVYLADSTGQTPVAVEDLRVALNAIRRRVPRWAQPATPYRDIKNGEFLTLTRSMRGFMIDLKARIQQGESIFSFSFASSDPWVLSMSLEVPLIGWIEKEVLGAFGASVKPEGFDIWVPKAELLANNKDKTRMRLVLVGRRGDKDTEMVPTCGSKQEYEIAFTTSLGSLSEGSIKAPDARCPAIIAGPELQAGSRLGNAKVQARATNMELFGLRIIKFLLVQPSWQLLVAALGGSLGALLAEYRRLAGRPHYRIKYADFVGPFLVMGMAVGFVFYIAVYYGAYSLSIIPFSPHVAFAIPVGAVAGYYGPGIIGKLISQFRLKKTRNT